MRPYANFRIQRTEFCVCPCAKTVPGYEEIRSFFKEHYLQQNSAPWSQLRFCLQTGSCMQEPFFQLCHCGCPFQRFNCICTMSKALLGSQTHQRDKDFSCLLASPLQVLQKCEVDTETKLNCSLLRMPGIPLLQSMGRQISAYCTSLLPQKENLTTDAVEAELTCLVSDNPKLCKYPDLFWNQQQTM